MSTLQVKRVTEINVIEALSVDLLKNIYTSHELENKTDNNYSREYLAFVIFVIKGQNPVGRLAVYENQQIRQAESNALVIGNFECINDKDVAAVLFQEAELFAEENSYSALIGPINGSTWDNYRLPVEGVHPRFFTEELLKNYYPIHFRQNKFEILTEYYSTIISNLNEYISDLEPPRDIFLNSSGLQVRGISKENFQEDMKLVYKFSMDLFSSNYLFSPVSETYFLKKYLPIKQFIDPDYCLLVFDKNDLVALFFCLPDIFNPSSSTLIVKTIAGKSGRKYAGISSWLFRRIIKKATQNGYTHIINAFMHKNNTSLNISLKYKSEIIRTYCLYIKNLEI